MNRSSRNGSFIQTVNVGTSPCAGSSNSPNGEFEDGVGRAVQLHLPTLRRKLRWRWRTTVSLRHPAIDPTDQRIYLRLRQAACILELPVLAIGVHGGMSPATTF